VRFYGHTYAEDWRADNMVAAAMFHLTETIPSLRATLRRPVSNPRDFDRVRARTEAAITLSALGDTASAALVKSWLVDLETISWVGLWSDTFDAFLRLDASAAEIYALELMERAANGTLGHDIPSDRLAVLSALTPASASEALPLLRTLTADSAMVPFDGPGHAACLLFAARLRLGDSGLVAEAREQMAGELTKLWAINCFSEVRDALPWNDPEDVDALVHRRAYEAMLRWLEAPATRSNERARSKLRAWLVAELTSPGVSQPDHVQYHSDTRAMHLAALAALGDPKATGLLYDMVTDPTDTSDGPWIASYHALRFGLTGALEHARHRLRIGLSQGATRGWYESPVGPEKNWRTRVIDEMIRTAPSDPAWVLGLLDATVMTREAVLWRLSRIHPKGVCEVVASAAAGACEEAVSDAFWALTTLGDRCRSAVEPLARDESRDAKVRGPAIEYLAMIRHPDAAAMARQVLGKQALRAAAGRAIIIAASNQ
jgi:hypothetical protein